MHFMATISHFFKAKTNIFAFFYPMERRRWPAWITIFCEVLSSRPILMELSYFHGPWILRRAQCQWDKVLKWKSWNDVKRAGVTCRSSYKPLLLHSHKIQVIQYLTLVVTLNEVIILLREIWNWHKKLTHLQAKNRNKSFVSLCLYKCWCLMYTLTLCVVCHWYFCTLHFISCSHIITFVKRWTVLRQDFVFSKVAWADICSFFTHYTNGGRMTSLSISLVSVFILLSQEPTFTQLLHFQYIAHCQYCLLSTYLHSGYLLWK